MKPEHIDLLEPGGIPPLVYGRTYLFPENRPPRPGWYPAYNRTRKDDPEAVAPMSALEGGHGYWNGDTWTHWVVQPSQARFMAPKRWVEWRDGFAPGIQREGVRWCNQRHPTEVTP